MMNVPERRYTVVYKCPAIWVFVRYKGQEVPVWNLLVVAEEGDVFNDEVWRLPSYGVDVAREILRHHFVQTRGEAEGERLARDWAKSFWDGFLRTWTGQNPVVTNHFIAQWMADLSLDMLNGAPRPFPWSTTCRYLVN